MLIDLVIEIIPLIISTSPIKADQFIGFVFHTNKKSSAIGISKAGYAFQPAYYIIPIKFCLTLHRATFNLLYP